MLGQTLEHQFGGMQRCVWIKLPEPFNGSYRPVGNKWVARKRFFEQQVVSILQVKLGQNRKMPSIDCQP